MWARFGLEFMTCSKNWPEYGRKLRIKIEFDLTRCEPTTMGEKSAPVVGSGRVRSEEKTLIFLRNPKLTQPMIWSSLMKMGNSNSLEDHIVGYNIKNNLK